MCIIFHVFFFFFSACYFSLFFPLWQESLQSSSPETWLLPLLDIYIFFREKKKKRRGEVGKRVYSKPIHFPLFFFFLSCKEFSLFIRKNWENVQYIVASSHNLFFLLKWFRVKYRCCWQHERLIDHGPSREYLHQILQGVVVDHYSLLISI